MQPAAAPPEAREPTPDPTETLEVFLDQDLLEVSCY